MPQHNNSLRAYFMLQAVQGMGSTSLMPLYSVVSDTLKPYTVVRGIHVHELRHSDPELSRLSTLELLSRAEDDFGKSMKSLFLKDYRTTRNKWAQKIKREIGAIKKLLDYYFGQLTKAVFQDKRLIIPTNYR
ncbi:MAG: hypothetical protein HY755_00250 [Nitrospirae bacterium]|nr:hypothetical protein [Nitrospirota bacterium]MBI4847113.1 hypothetical protein [Nitrospirota bacterium]